MLVPITNVYAASGGLLDGKNIKVGPNINLILDTTNDVTDGNNSTFYTLSGGSSLDSVKDHLFFEFENIMDINSYYVRASGNQLRMHFFDYQKNYLGYINEPLTLDSKVTITEYKKVKYVAISNYSSTNININELDVFGKLSPVVKEEVTNLNLVNENEGVKITWKNPTNNFHFAGIKIYRNGTLLTTLNKETEVFLDNSIQLNSSYNYKITALYSGDIETEGTIQNIKTPEPLILKEVTAEPDVKRVDLSWKLPNNEKLKHVNIYRDTVQEQTALLRFFFGESVKAAETKIFETNGTYFNDLTVEPETTYEYTLSITDTSGQETGYTDIEVTTLEEPPPVLTEGNLEETETGDYKFTWNEPTEGTVRILVGGQEYATVDATNKEIIIPKADMKYTAIGDPDVSAIPISESGKEGKKTKPPSTIDNVQLPFDYKELVNAGSQLLWIIAPFVLLALSFLLVPKLRRLIINAFKGKKGKEKIETERRTQSDRSERKDRSLLKRERMEKEKLEKDKSRIELKDTTVDSKDSREIRVRERAFRQPKIRKERTIKEPRISRVSNEPRREREIRQTVREPRMPREIRKGR